MSTTHKGDWMRVQWHRVEPTKPCLSPDGHDYVDLMTSQGEIPVRVLCPRCSETWQVVVLPADEELNDG